MGESGDDNDDGDHNCVLMCTACSMHFTSPESFLEHECSSIETPTPSVYQRTILSPPASDLNMFGRRFLEYDDELERCASDQSGGRSASLIFQGDQDESHILQDAVDRHGCSVLHSRNEFLPSREKETCQSYLKERESQNINVTISEDYVLNQGEHTAPTPRTEIPSPAEKKPCQKSLELAVDDQWPIYLKDAFDQGQCSAPLSITEFLPPTEHRAEPKSQKQRNSVAVETAEEQDRKLEEEMSVSSTGTSSSSTSSVAPNSETDDEELEGRRKFRNLSDFYD